MTRCLLAVFLVVAAASAVAQSQLWRWTDERGRVHITDTPPPPGAKNVQAPKSVREKETDAAANEPFALQIARKDFPVTLYSTPGCEACGEARKLLNARGIPFKEVLVSDEKSLSELKAAVGSTSVPAIIIGSTVQKGYEEATYHRLLDAAGYPKTGVLSPRNQAEPKPVEPESAQVKPAPDPNAGLGPYAPGAARQQRPTKSADKK
ncbi:MAG: glutaredoxin family protein [Betaproteobacteria bacterium]